MKRRKRYLFKLGIFAAMAALASDNSGVVAAIATAAALVCGNGGIAAAIAAALAQPFVAAAIAAATAGISLPAHAQTVPGGVEALEIKWSGGAVPDDQYDEFVLRLRGKVPIMSSIQGIR